MNILMNNNISDFALLANQNGKNTSLASKITMSEDTQKMKKASQDFEAFFISQSFEQMFAGLNTNGLFGGGNAEKIWRSFLLDEYGKEIAKGGGIGIADKVMSYMLQQQEQATNKNDTSVSLPIDKIYQGTEIQASSSIEV